MRIAVVQFQITLGDREKNVHRIELFMQQASEAAAHVIVFPEDCITGSIFGDLTKLDRDQSNRTRSPANPRCPS